jgi:hypothetical protein
MSLRKHRLGATAKREQAPLLNTHTSMQDGWASRKRD